MTTNASSAAPADFGSLFEMVTGGGPLMIPLALCSVVAMAYAVERWVRLRSNLLGGKRLANEVARTVRDEGPARGAELCKRNNSRPLARILAVALERSDRPVLERERAVEDAGEREVKRLSANLQPLVLVAVVAPLLGLLGTVWGMIEAFSSIALRDGLGRPEELASGISQALITTATGLAIAIPAQVLYYHFRARIDRFAQRAEDGYEELARSLAVESGEVAA